MYKLSIFLLISSFIISNYSCTHTKNTIAQNQLMLGKVHRKDFKNNLYKTWFNSEYNSYALDKKNLSEVKNKLDSKDILIYFGSWCSDSRREVPRFIKILDYLNVSYKKVHFTALDRTKTAPNYKNNIWNIVYVPTFIILENGKEIGRIIETPEESLELDLLKILNK